MPAIQSRITTSYYSPTRNRRYFTRQAAKDAEARSLIAKKYPPEEPERDGITGQATSHGWHPSELPNYEKMVRRLSRMIDVV